MAIGVAALVIGALVGLARGGRPRNVGRLLHMRWPAVGAAGLGGLAVIRWGDVEAPEMLLATSLVLCLVCVVRNLWLRGTGVIAVGLLANLAPLLANGTMPVDADALVHAGLSDRARVAAADLGGGRAVADDDTVLAPLGKVIPVPELGAVLSFGDLVVAVGIGAAAANTLRRRRQGGVPIRAILEADDAGRTIDLRAEPAASPVHGGRHERPVEVAPGQPVPVPVGWARDGDRSSVDRRGREPVPSAAGHEGRSPQVPWPWRRQPPRAHHPTMRAARR